VRELFGQPTFRRTVTETRLFDKSHTGPTEVEYTEHIWMLASDGHVQVLTDTDEAIVSYTLTTTNKSFHPLVWMGYPQSTPPGFGVKLGKTRFAAIPWSLCTKVDWFIGASAPSGYNELYHYGRPGGYANWICAHVAMGYGQFRLPDIPMPNSESKTEDTPSLWRSKLSDEHRQHLDQCRKESTINSVTVSASNVRLDPLELYGVYREMIQWLPRQPSWWNFSARWALRRRQREARMDRRWHA
jgi:hypothetical protein